MPSAYSSRPRARTLSSMVARPNVASFEAANMTGQGCADPLGVSIQRCGRPDEPRKASPERRGHPAPDSRGDLRERVDRLHPAAGDPHVDAGPGPPVRQSWLLFGTVGLGRWRGRGSATGAAHPAGRSAGWYSASRRGAPAPAHAGPRQPGPIRVPRRRPAHEPKRSPTPTRRGGHFRDSL